MFGFHVKHRDHPGAIEHMFVRCSDLCQLLTQVGSFFHKCAEVGSFSISATSLLDMLEFFYNHKRYVLARELWESILKLEIFLEDNFSNKCGLTEYLG